jgi:hypothetical protein
MSFKNKEIAALPMVARNEERRVVTQSSDACRHEDQGPQALCSLYQKD